MKTYTIEPRDKKSCNPCKRVIVSTVLLSAAALLLLLLTSCGSKSIYSTSVVKDIDAISSMVPEIKNTGDALVVVRFPVFVENKAQSRFTELYELRRFDNYFKNPPDKNESFVNPKLNSRKFKLEFRDNPINSVSRSTYVGMAVYESLWRTLPPGSVIMQPVTIDLRDVAVNSREAIKLGEAAPKALTFKSNFTLPPTAILVDVYAFGFAKKVEALITVRTSPLASQSTYGGIAMPEEFLPYARRPHDNAGLFQGLGVTCLDYLSGTEGIPPDQIVLENNFLVQSLAESKEKLFVLPVASFDISQATFELLQKGRKGYVSEKEHRILAEINAIVLKALNWINYNAATKTDRGRYIEQYDYRLADRWLSGHNLTEEDQKKLIMLRKFEQTEISFLTRQDRKLMDNSYFGSWGLMMQAKFTAEGKYQDDVMRVRKEASSAQNAQAMQAIVTSINTSMPGLTGNATPDQQMQMAIQNIQTGINSMIQNGQNQNKLDQDLNSLGRQFRNHMSAFTDEPQRIAFDMFGEKQEISARSLEELRIKMRALYLKKFYK
ncbi:MAG: hypothetical protein HY757_10715 [Nitrospirae bacterium]|nr:hypothetical protein [Nitrospirota bacterium]